MKKNDIESHNQPAIKRRKLKDKVLDFLISKLDGNKRNNKDFEKLLKGEKTYTVHTQGTGRKTKYVDCEEYYTSELNKIGVKFELLNDAPRGGKTGNFIQVNLDSCKTSYDYFNLKDGYLTDNKIDLICKFYEIYNYTKNSDKTIDVDGDVYLQGKNLKKLPLKFNIVNGNFNCSENYLTSLKGAPVFVAKEFSCRDNHLTDVKHAPLSVKGNFNCSQNKLTSLQGYPNDAKQMNCWSNTDLKIDKIPGFYEGNIRSDFSKSDLTTQMRINKITEIINAI